MHATFSDDEIAALSEIAERGGAVGSLRSPSNANSHEIPMRIFSPGRGDLMDLMGFSWERHGDSLGLHGLSWPLVQRTDDVVVPMPAQAALRCLHARLGQPRRPVRFNSAKLTGDAKDQACLTFWVDPGSERRAVCVHCHPKEGTGIELGAIPSSDRSRRTGLTPS